MLDAKGATRLAALTLARKDMPVANRAAIGLQTHRVAGAHGVNQALAGVGGNVAQHDGHLPGRVRLGGRTGHEAGPRQHPPQQGPQAAPAEIDAGKNH